MVASYKFLQKLWNLHEIILNKINTKTKNNEIEKKLEKFVNEKINRYDYNLDKFNYNVLIANLYETYNFLSSIVKNEFDGDVLKVNYIKILTIISPIIPHFTSECLENLNIENLEWPKVDKEKLFDETISIVIRLMEKKGVI